MPSKASSSRSSSSPRASRRASTDLPAESGKAAELQPRERILATARRQFMTWGFATATMDELATELGMSKKTLYQHFRSKEALLEELITRKSQRMLGGFEAILAEPDASFAQRTSAFLRHAHAEFSEISLPFIRDVRRFAPALHARLEDLRARNLPRLWEQLLQLGIREGAVRDDIDVRFVARLVLVAVQSLLQPETLERLSASPHEAVPRFFDLILNGLLTEQGHHDYENHRETFTRPPGRS
jgi:AcrR family transcriptional regulator